MNDNNMDKFAALSGSPELWAGVMLGLAVATLLVRSGFMLLGHLYLFQDSSINGGDMAKSVFKIGVLLVAGLAYFGFVS